MIYLAVMFDRIGLSASFQLQWKYHFSICHIAAISVNLVESN